MQENTQVPVNNETEFEALRKTGISNLESMNPEEEAMCCVAADIAIKYGILPLAIRENKLYVAMSEPFNIVVLDDIRFLTKKSVIPISADKQALTDRIAICFSARGDGLGGGTLQNNPQSKSGGADRQHPAGLISGAHGSSGAYAGFGELDGTDTAEVGEAPAVRLVDAILSKSVALKASDIHLEPFEKEIRVRYRVDGSLSAAEPIPTALYAAVSTRIKIIAGMDIAEKRLPQDGRIEKPISGKVFDFRVSSLPTVHGEKIEIRKLDRSGFSFNRTTLGFTDKENQSLDEILKKPNGIILVTGPTGSGKSTTIYSLLGELNHADRNIVTVEDPVEYMVDGINQVQVNNKAGLTFAGGLRSILRQDPDIIMIGEIRDEETANIAVRAAITGHVVLSTLHTNDAPGAIARLVDMGIEPYLLSEALNCVIAQRLVRKLCGHCKQEQMMNETERRALRLDSPVPVYYPVGCPHCNQLGYAGRRAIHEVLVVDSALKHEIEHDRNAEKIRALARSTGMTALYDDCRSLVLNGVTSIQEMVRTVYAADESR